MIDTFFDNASAILDWVYNQVFSIFAKAPLVFAVVGVYIVLSLFVWLVKRFLYPD